MHRHCMDFVFRLIVGSALVGIDSILRTDFDWSSCFVFFTRELGERQVVAQMRRAMFSCVMMTLDA